MVVVGIDLVSKGKITGLYLTIVSNILYGYIAYSTGLLGEAIKNVGILCSS